MATRRVASTALTCLRRHSTAIAGVKHVIAVASGKGGVGKSTTAVNLAIALSRCTRGMVGLLDADIYGPTVGRMMNLSGRLEMDAERKLVPKYNHGLAVMSMAFLAPNDDAPAVWRGPMVMSMLQTMIRKTAWGPLDYLVVDTPPGTGDAHLTLTQTVSLSGAVIVSTPQDVALLAAVKGVAMFRQVSVPILGMIENMSYHECSKCGHQEHVFGNDGVRRKAAELQVPFLGALPLDIQIRQAADTGAPIVVSKPDSPQARAYMQLAESVARAVSPGDSASGVTVAAPKATTTFSMDP